MKKYLAIFIAIKLMLFMLACGANLQPETPMLSGFEIYETDNITEINLVINAEVEPVVSFVRSASLLQIDLPGVKLNKNLLDNPTNGRNVRLAYAVENHDSSWPSVGVRIYPEEGRVASLRKIKNGLKILVAEKLDLPAEKQLTQPILISPQDKKYAPVIINCEHMPLLPAFSELALSAGIDISYEGEFADSAGIFVEASDPFAAIKELADINGLKLFRTGQNSWLLKSLSSDKS